MTETPRPWGLVLAAGTGPGFAGDRFLGHLNGRPIVAHVATTLAEAIATRLLAGGLAVLPAGDTRLGWHFDTAGLDLVHNPEVESSFASSLRLGLAALEGMTSTPAPAAALIALADQPYLRREVIERLVAAWRTTGRSVYPRYRASPEDLSFPVLLDRSLWPSVHAMSADSWLGSILRAQPDAVILLDIPGANPDFDTPADLDRVKSNG